MQKLASNLGSIGCVMLRPARFEIRSEEKERRLQEIFIDDAFYLLETKNV